jgi:hypothetical protein
MHEFLLTFHNIWRWVVLILAIVAAVMAYIGWFGKRTWTERDRKLGSFTAIAMDIQVLLGFILYLFYSPFGLKGLQLGMQTVRSSRDFMFYGIEHVFYMLVALVMAHLGSILPRKAQDSAAKYMRAAIPFTILFLILILGIPWGRPLLRLFGLSVP